VSSIYGRFQGRKTTAPENPKPEKLREKGRVATAKSDVGMRSSLVFVSTAVLGRWGKEDFDEMDCKRPLKKKGSRYRESLGEKDFLREVVGKVPLPVEKEGRNEPGGGQRKDPERDNSMNSMTNQLLF